VGLHPLPKGPKQGGLSGWKEARGCGCYPACGLEEVDEVTRPHKEVAQATTGIPQALEPVEGMPIRL
jgi:hypothetical protein